MSPRLGLQHSLSIHGSQNPKKLQAEVFSFYKDLGIMFHCYLLSTVKEKIYRNLPWWKEIITIQNS
jgi:hypothetical protein